MKNGPSFIPSPRAAVVSLAATAALGALHAAPAQAAFAECASNQPAAKVVGDIGAAIEGAVVDRSGRLYVTDLLGGRILRFDTPGAAPKVLSTIPSKNGGGALALEPDGTVIVGTGADPRVFLGDVLRPGAISRVNQVTGALTEIAKGFSAANGLDVTANGTIYATNDFGALVGRRTPDGKVNAAWTVFPSANGAVLSKDDQYLYVSRTFVNPGVSRIPIANPAKPESLLDLGFADLLAFPDGLTLDSKDRPVVPMNGSGDIVRIDAPGKACKLASGLNSSSVVVYGRGTKGFSAGRLFRAGFDGKVYEVPSAFDAGASTNPAA
ncbi:MAG: SMP-30/gluconolactonase/LRE family protein [Solirubrobacteraceae bacterium]|nr:SMP-30/gluconolactonase/LRE family protein [Solirubrobacteraceae bacterium]